MKKTALLKKIVFAVVVIFVCYQLGSQIWLNWQQVYPRLVKFNIFWGLGAICLTILHYLFGALIWEIILAKMLVPLPVGKGVRIWAMSQLGRYIPGKIWALVGRVHLCEQENIPKVTTTISISLDFVLAIMAAVLLFLAGLPFWPAQLLLADFKWVLFLIPCFLVFLHPRIFEYILNFLLQLMKQEPVKVNLGFGILLEIVLLAMFNWLVVGGALFCIIRAIYPLNLSVIPLMAGTFAIAWILGMSALFAPSGIGVREGVLAYLLSFYVPVYIASLVAILSRFIFTLAEAFFCMIVFIMTREGNS